MLLSRSLMRRMRTIRHDPHISSLDEKMITASYCLDRSQ